MKGRWNNAEIKVYNGGWFTLEDYGLKVRIKSLVFRLNVCKHHLCSIRQAVIRMSINVKTAPMIFGGGFFFISYSFILDVFHRKVAHINTLQMYGQNIRL